MNAVGHCSFCKKDISEDDYIYSINGLKATPEEPMAGMIVMEIKLCEDCWDNFSHDIELSISN